MSQPNDSSSRTASRTLVRESTLIEIPKSNEEGTFIIEGQPTCLGDTIIADDNQNAPKKLAIEGELAQSVVPAVTSEVAAGDSPEQPKDNKKEKPKNRQLRRQMDKLADSK